MQRCFDVAHRKYFRCVCDHPDHVVVLSDDPDFGKTIEIHLNPFLGFFKRCLVALRYIFKSRTGYNAWDTVHIADDDHELIKEWLDSRE